MQVGVNAPGIPIRTVRSLPMASPSPMASLLGAPGFFASSDTPAIDAVDSLTTSQFLSLQQHESQQPSSASGVVSAPDEDAGGDADWLPLAARCASWERPMVGRRLLSRHDFFDRPWPNEQKVKFAALSAYTCTHTAHSFETETNGKKRVYHWGVSLEERWNALQELRTCK